MNSLLMGIVIALLGSSPLPALAAQGAVKAENAAQSPLVASYLKLQEALANDSLEAAKSAARELEREAGAAKATAVKDKAAKIAASSDIKVAREEFKALYEPMGQFAKGQNVDVVYCPMAKAKWYQSAGKVKNPYFGKDMLECGVIEKKKR